MKKTHTGAETIRFKRFLVVGMGPGHADYMLPEALRAIDEAEVLIGAKRHLADYRKSGKTFFEISGKFSSVLDTIDDERKIKKVAVLVSGDPCLYSFLGMIASRFGSDEYRIVPGLSSFQIACARVGIQWQTAKLLSAHGRGLESLAREVRSADRAVIFTDPKHNPTEIAKLLIHERISCRCWAFENISYENERIRSGSLDEIASMHFPPLSLLIVDSVQQA
jgi:precorrin-6y C5,15-methyltransferase (decarboxylating) CbiE subunit